MTKNEIRQQYKARRQLLSNSEIEANSQSVLQQLIKNIDVSNKTVSLFFTIENQKEINTQPLFDYLKEQKCTITGSISNFKDNTLAHRTVSNLSELSINTYGIPEPTDGIVIFPENFDIVFVPLLACDTKGKRVGYGKGFYDRFLAQCNSNCIFIGLNFFEPIDNILDSNNQDIPLHILITPKTIHHFSESTS